MEEDVRLLEAVKDLAKWRLAKQDKVLETMDDNLQTIIGKHWLCVAERVGRGRTYESCRTRYQFKHMPGCNSGPWGEAELRRLEKGVKLFSNQWINVAAYVKTRNRRQCALKWLSINRLVKLRRKVSEKYATEATQQDQDSLSS